MINRLKDDAGDMLRTRLQNNVLHIAHAVRFLRPALMGDGKRWVYAYRVVAAVSKLLEVIPAAHAMRAEGGAVIGVFAAYYLALLTLPLRW